MTLPHRRDVALFLASLCILLTTASSATTFTVGDSNGWTLGVDYASWTTGKTFKVGDVLYFPYDQGSHNVAEVPKTGYDSCSTANAISNDLAAGNTKITLTTSGNHYYICGVVGHCGRGMKLAVDVATASSKAPSSSPSSSPSPVPHVGSSPASVPNVSPSPTPASSNPPSIAPSTLVPSRSPISSAPSSSSVPKASPSPAHAPNAAPSISASPSSVAPTPARTPSQNSSISSGPTSSSPTPQGSTSDTPRLVRGAVVGVASFFLCSAILFF